MGNVGESWLAQAISKVFNPNEINSNQTEFFITIFIAFLTILFVVIFLLNRGLKELDNATANIIYYWALIVTAISIVFVFYKNFQNKAKRFGGFILLIVLFFIMIYITEYVEKNRFLRNQAIPVLFQLIMISIILVGFAIFYKVLRERINRLTGVIGFIANFILFIPCLITDFIEYIKDQFKITPSVVYILFVIEISLILVFVSLPRLLKQDLVKYGNVFDGPYDLHNETKIANSEDLPKSNEIIQNVTESIKNNNYSLMMWIYLNPVNSSNVTKKLFTYGYYYKNDDHEEVEDWKPKIEYVPSKRYDINDDDNRDNEGKLKITFGKHDTYIKYIDIPKQKWNFIVFNYDDSSVDLYLNAKLIRTVYFVENIIPIQKDCDEIILGDEDGIEGSICNVSYSAEVLTKEKIATYYNLLINKNPPLNNIM